MPDTVEDLIRAEARRQKIPSALALAVAEQESGFNPTLTNPKDVGGEHATGVFQLLPSTAKGLGVDPSDARQNISGGVKYLRQLLDKHQGDPNKVLAEYGGVKTDTTYVPAVTALFQKWKPTEDAADTAFFSQAARASAQGAAAAVPPPGAPAGGPAAPAASTPPPPGAVMQFPPGQQPNVIPGQAKIEPLEGGGLLKDIGMGILRAHNPATQEGRQNLFALGGELTAGALVPEVEGPIWAMRAQRIGVPLVGAMVASGGEQAAENALGTGNLSPALEAAGWQGAYNVLGPVTLWPFKRAGKWMTGTSVAKGAKTMLEENLARAGERMKSDIAGARRTADQFTTMLRQKRDEAIEAGRLLTQNTLETIRAEGADLLSKLPTARAAGAAVRSGVAGQSRAQITAFASKSAATELANDTALADVKSVFDDVSKQFSAPGMLRTAQLAREVFEGPTKIALDQAGERVAAAAAAGPPISIAPVQATLAHITEVAKPAQLFQGAEADAATQNVGVLANLAANTQGKSASGVMAVPQVKMSADEFKQWVMAQRAETAPEKMAPVPEILARIRDLADPEMDFATGHALKKLLDERVRWDRPARAINEQLTKATRIALREQLDDPEYNAANATYGSLVNLYRKGMGAKMQHAFANDPDAAALLLNPGKPVAARMLKALLVDQAAAGGNPQLGQQAWDAARTTFVHQKLMNGGIEGLEKKLHQLTTTNAEFTQAVFGGDDTGQSVLHNLQSIVHSYNNVLRENAARTAELRLAGRLERAGMADEGALATSVAADTAATAREAVKTATASKVAREQAAGRGRVNLAKRQGRDAIADAKEKGAEAVRAAEEGGKAKVTQAAEDLNTFRESSLGSQKQSIAGTIGDLGHVLYTKGQTRGGLLALLRLLNGPSSADLLTYMAISPKATNLFQQAARGYTKGVLSPTAERAATELWRLTVSYMTAPQAQGAGPAAAQPVAPPGRGPGPVGVGAPAPMQ